MRVRVIGTAGPGRDCPAGTGFPGYTDVRVGLQRKAPSRELLGVVPGDVAEAVWEIEVRVTAKAAGPDVTGDQVQGRPGDRFLYLSWLGDGSGAVAAVFRRAKLMFDAVPGETLTEAAETGLLTAHLSLTDPLGRPICAAVRPPAITWTAGPPPWFTEILPGARRPPGPRVP
ncbi:DUF5990 family protein [Actinocorallia longicatena]|uniref:Monooxygenase n=1 Tax=Actinocorallia longicatena TaxID=111803 RepID=A0ABP6QGS3_9ACTN